MPDQAAENKLTPQVQENTKTLLLIRHAKSSWEASVASDFERPLNDRGKRDAPVMAFRLKEKKIIPDAFVSSPAKRAFATASIFCEVFDVSAGNIILVPSLYHAAPETFFDVVSDLDNRYNTVALFSHNTGLTTFVNMLTENVHVDNVPTCGIFGLSIMTKSWATFRESSKTFLLFDYPKK